MSQRARGYSRRAVLRFGALVAASGLFSACQSGERRGSPPPGAAGQGAAPAGQPAGLKELEFTTFYTGADGGIMQGLVDRYNQSQQAAKINFSAPAWGSDYLTKLQTSAMAGNPPPIVALHNYEIPPLAQFLYEIDPATLGVKKEDLVDVAWKLPMYEGKLRGLTMSTGTLGLFYNKEHFQQAGLDPGRPPTNRDEFIKAAQALTRDGRYGFARDSAGWMPWLTFNWQAGGDLLSEDGKKALFDTPAAIEAARLEQDMIHKYEAAVPEKIPGDDMLKTFSSGRVSMMFLGPWNLNAIIKSNRENGTNFGWAKMPVFFDKKQAVMSTSHIYGLMRQKPEDPIARDLGARFITWLLQEGSVTWAQAQAPTNKAALDQMKTSSDPIVQGMTMWVEQAEHAHFPPYHPFWGEAYRALSEAMEAIAFQGSSVESTLRETTVKANEALARA